MTARLLDSAGDRLHDRTLRIESCPGIEKTMGQVCLGNLTCSRRSYRVNSARPTTLIAPPVANELHAQPQIPICDPCETPVRT